MSNMENTTYRCSTAHVMPKHNPMINSKLILINQI